MANKHMTAAPHHVIRIMQITTIRYHLRMSIYIYYIDIYYNVSMIYIVKYYNVKNLEHWQYQMLTRVQGKRHLPSLLLRMQKEQPLCKTVQWFLTKLNEHALALRHSKHTPWYLPKGGENLCPHTNLQTDVAWGLINNKNLFLTVLGAGRSKIKAPVDVVSSDDLLPH